MTLIAGMASWSEGLCFGLYDLMGWLITKGITHVVGAFSHFCGSLIFKNKGEVTIM